jgi:hypothetical protein
MSSIRALPRNCSLATPKHSYVHYDTCRSRCANIWASPQMSPTHSHVPELPFLLLPTLTLPCGSHAPRASIAPVPGKTRTVLTPSAIPCLTASPPPSLSPVVRLCCLLGPTSRPHKLYRMDGASLSHSPQLKYSHWSIATSPRDIQTYVCMRISRVSCARAEWSGSINTFPLSLIVAPSSHTVFFLLSVPLLSAHCEFYTDPLTSCQHNSSFTSS